ncbi:MAG: hypothetical protein ACJ8FY_25715 [Gemmataceae bacterium]
MWATLTFLAATTFAPAQNDAIKFANERATYGVLGPTRTDTKFLPGDVFFLTFDIEGLKTDSAGKVKYSMGMELLDSKGASKFKGDPDPRELINSLGGSRLPASAHAVIGTDSGPGEYTMKITVADLANNKKSGTLTRKFTVVDSGFGLVRVNCTYDPEGKIPAPSMAVVGQSLWVNAFVAGFQRSSKKQPDLTLEIQLLGEDKKPTLEKPISFTIDSKVDESWSLIPVQSLLTLNRTGKFTVELKAEDKITRKTTRVAFPITVVEAPK